MMYKSIYLSLCLLLSTSFLFSQKKPLDHSVYDSWKSLSNTSISNDGKIIGALIAPQEGDTTLFLQNTNNNRTLTLSRVKSFVLSPAGRWTVGLIKAPFAVRRQARIDRKKAEEMPADSLLIVDNLTFAIQKIPGIKSFKTAKEFDSHVAYTINAPKDTTQKADKKKPKELLILHNILTQQEDTFRNVKEYLFSKFEHAFAVSIQPDKKDSTDVPRVVFIDLKDNSQKPFQTINGI